LEVSFKAEFSCEKAEIDNSIYKLAILIILKVINKRIISLSRQMY
jgi:hypothetical protein